MKLNLTPLQWIGLVLVVNGVLGSSATQLTTLFGPDIANKVIALCIIGSGICGGIVTMFSGQGALVNSVRSMTGVENITVNEKANATLAKIAVDPAVTNVEPTPRATAKVIETAKSG